MAERRRRYQKRRPEQWRRLVADQRMSGESVRGFARARGISESTLGHWSRIVGDVGQHPPEDCGVLALDVAGDGRGLVELVAHDLAGHREADEAEGMRLLVGSEVCLELGRLPAPEYLARLALALEGAAS